jgi:hypothetical protein
MHLLLDKANVPKVQIYQGTLNSMSIIAAPKDHHILIFATALLWS